MKSIYFIATEASGDLVASRIISAMKALNVKENIVFNGIGGILTQKHFSSVIPMQKLNIMGFTSVLTRIPTIYKYIHQTTQHIKHINPDIVVTIDAKGFNFRVLNKLNNTKKIHVVSPSFWAFNHKSPQAQLQPLRDIGITHTLLLLPFEQQLYNQMKIPSTYIGYPAVEELMDYAELKHPPPSTQGNFNPCPHPTEPNFYKCAQAIRSMQPEMHMRHSKKEEHTSNTHREGQIQLIAIFPGSRLGEVSKNLSVLVSAAEVTNCLPNS